jgi:hypothetical protein
MAYPYDIASNTPKKYKFVLKSSSGTVTCSKEPLEWKEGVLQVHRDLKAGGIFVSFQVQSLTFVGNGAAHLRNLFNTYQINATCDLYIYYFDEFSTRTYISFPGVFSAKFVSYKTVKVGKFAFGVNIEFVDTGFYSKFNDRKRVMIDLTRTESIGGMTLLDYDGFTDNSKLKFPALTNSYYAKLLDKCLFSNDTLYLQYVILPYSTTSTGYNAVPLLTVSSDFPEVQTVAYGSDEYGQQNITDLTPIFHEATEEKTLVCAYDLYVKVDDGLGYTYREALQLQYAIYDGAVEIDVQNVDDAFGQHAAVRHKTGSFTVTLAEGESLYFFMKRTAPASVGSVHWVRAEGEDWGCKLTIREDVVNTAEVIVDGLPLYEAFDKCCQIMLDQQYPFYSEFLGREDTPFNADGDMYASENSNRFAHICSGVNIRGVTIFDSDGKINTSFEKLFKSASACYCLGYTIETIDELEKLRVENYAYFFQDVEILDLSSRITAYDIESEYLSEMAYIQILTGYENYVYRSSNGRGEYNTENTRTTELNASEELDIKSDFRADTIGIVNCLEKPSDTYGSEDIDEDENVFIIKTQRVSESDHEWLVETDETIAIENESSMFGDSSLNLYFTPTRNMIRNAPLYMPALSIMESSKIRFQTSGKLSTLETTGEGYTVVENDDISVSGTTSPLVLAGVDEPLFKPILHKVTCLFTMADITTLMATGVDDIPNRYKKIKLSDTISGYLVDIKKKNAEDKATIEIIEIY